MPEDHAEMIQIVIVRERTENIIMSYYCAPLYQNNRSGLTKQKLSFLLVTILKLVSHYGTVFVNI